MTSERSETVYEYLERRERELTNQIADLRGQLEGREAEFAHVQSAKRQIGNLGGAEKARFGVPEPSPSDAAAQADTTIKVLIMRAMWAGFREKGATAPEVRQFIIDAYGRDIDRTSISPQLSRLKADGQLKQKLDENKEEKWFLTKDAIARRI